MKPVGNTPLVRLSKLESSFGLDFEVYAKVELHNPSGSIKDRAASEIVTNAFARGELKEGYELVEATSGNMGISLALIASQSGLGCRIYMPVSASPERQKMMEEYGAKVIRVKGGMKECVQEALSYVKEHDGVFYCDQFNNQDSVLAHLKTGQEIIDNLGCLPSYFVAGVGTGGTITGSATRLKEEASKQGQEIKIIGVEPLSSPLLTRGVAAAHKIQGIGANFVPSILRKDLIDEVVDVRDEDAYRFTRFLAKEEGLFVGISSGAAVAGLIQIKDHIQSGSKVVLILPDSGNRYLSVEGLYD